ncbi:MAG: hydrogenase maturation peptidase HycI [bacterium]
MELKLKGKVLVLGVGNSLKKDDGVGPAAIAEIKNQKSKIKNNVVLLDCGTVPENYTGKIKKTQPDTLVIIDAVDFQGRAGEVRVFEVEKLAINNFSTHGISLKTFVGFLKEDLPQLNVIIVGVQPKEVAFGEGLSPEIKKAVDKLCTSFI